jgi:hypothetical protein
MAEIDSTTQRKLNRLNKGLDSAEQLMTALGDLDNALRHLVFTVKHVGISEENFNNTVGPVATAADKVRRFSFPASLYWGDDIIKLCDKIFSMCEGFTFVDAKNEKHPENIHLHLTNISRDIGKILARDYLLGETAKS